MGIVNWFTNNLDARDRALTRDLISVCIADGEFTDDERDTLLAVCQKEGIGSVELAETLRDRSRAWAVTTAAEKRRYVMNLIEVMAVDYDCRPQEIHVLEAIAQAIGIGRMQMLQFVLDAMKDGTYDAMKGTLVMDALVQYFVAAEQNETK